MEVAIKIKDEELDDLLQVETNKSPNCPTISEPPSFGKNCFQNIIDFIQLGFSGSNSKLMSPTKLSVLLKPFNEPDLRRPKLECFACGTRCFTRSEDRFFHFRKKHVTDFIKFFPSPKNPLSVTAMAEFIMRYIIGYAEKMSSERFIVRSWRRVYECLQDQAFSFASSEFQLGTTVYFIDKPPFFARNYKELKDGLELSQPECEWQTKSFLATRLVCYHDASASKLGMRQATRDIKTMIALEPGSCRRNTDELYYAEKKMPRCRPHQNILTSCLSYKCFRDQKNKNVKRKK